jgi:hypothetical protein
VKRETANTSAVLTPASFKIEEHSKIKRSIYLQRVKQIEASLQI